jgi:hypothetical protein
MGIQGDGCQENSDNLFHNDRNVFFDEFGAKV